MIVSEQATKGIIYAKFESTGDAQEAFTELSQSHLGWFVHFILEGQFLALLRPDEMVYASDADNVLTITAHHQGQKESFDVGLVVALIKDLLSVHGKITAFETFCTSIPVVTLRVNFLDSEAANNVVRLSPINCAVRINGLSKTKAIFKRSLTARRVSTSS